MLISKGALPALGIDAPDSNGNTALALPVYGEHVDAALLLLQAGAAADTVSYSRLQQQCKDKVLIRPELLRMLVALCPPCRPGGLPWADLGPFIIAFQQCSRHQSLVHVAATHGWLETVRMLRERG